MCRSEADAIFRLGALLGFLLVVALCPGGWAWAQGGSPASSEMELTPPVSQALGRLPELWIEWVNAFYQDDAVDASATVGELKDTAARHKAVVQILLVLAECVHIRCSE